MEVARMLNPVEDNGDQEQSDQVDGNNSSATAEDKFSKETLHSTYRELDDLATDSEYGRLSRYNIEGVNGEGLQHPSKRKRSVAQRQDHEEHPTGSNTDNGVSKKKRRRITTSAGKAKGNGKKRGATSRHENDDDDVGNEEDLAVEAERLQTDYQGSSTQRPTAPPAGILPRQILDVPWPCSHRLCNTGQTWYNRDHIKDSEGKLIPGYGRKQVSHYFGRNKQSTSLVHPDVWVWSCRKHYQRDKYAREKGEPKDCISDEVNLLQVQVDRIELWRPDAKFDIQLIAGMKARLQHYHAAYRRNGNDAEAAAEKVYTQYPRTKDGKKPEDCFPFDLAEKFDSEFSETDGCYADIRNVLEWAKKEGEAGSLIRMPPFEFLLQAKKDGERETDPTANYTLWLAAQDAKAEELENVQPSIETVEEVDVSGHREASVAIEEEELCRQASTAVSDSPSLAYETSVKGRPLSSTKGATKGSGIRKPAKPRSCAESNSLPSARSESSARPWSNITSATAKGKKRALESSDTESEDDHLAPRTTKRSRV